MLQVGVKELRNRITHYLRLVKEGEQVIVTDSGRPFAEVRALDPTLRRSHVPPRLLALAARGIATLGTGGPFPDIEPIAVGGKPLSEIVLEDRR